MSETSTKTPLQAVVSVICDMLTELPPDDQARALEAARVTLGLRAPVTGSFSRGKQPSATPTPRTAWEPREVPPMVEIQMMGGTPRVVNGPNPSTDQPRQRLVVVDQQQRGQGQQRQLPAPTIPASGPTVTDGARRGYVRSRDR